MKVLTLWKNFNLLNLRLVIYVLLVFSGLASTAAQATMMTYSVTGTSGFVLDGTTMNPDIITFTMYGDSASAGPIPEGADVVSASGMFVNIAGEDYQVSDDIYLYRLGTSIHGFFFDAIPEPIPMIFFGGVEADFDTTITESLTLGGSSYLISPAHPMTIIPVDGQSSPLSLTLVKDDFHLATYSAQPVPEPGTALLLGLGMFGLAYKRLLTRERVRRLG